MLCILSPSNNPQFNLAAEEYIFRNINENIFFLYVNAPSVVVGKHQNALAETNPQFIRENNIDVIRRLSGGGAVYHDLGNLNFSFHETVEDTGKISFSSFNEPIVEVLKTMGVPAEISKRNDIFVDGFKVSGHAEHVFRKKILSHGTLLFNAQRENLSKALKNTSGSFKGKAIQSVRSKVANIVEFLDDKIPMNDFVEKVKLHILQSDASNKEYFLSSEDKEHIQKLVDEKYSTWEWNFGYSPKYRFEKTIAVDSKHLKLSIFVEKGKIQEIELSGDLISTAEKKAIQLSLLNDLHEYHTIERKLKKLSILDAKLLIDVFF